MTHQDTEDFLKDRIRSRPIHEMCGRLDLLPIGVEIILNRPWTADDIEKYSAKLGWEVFYELKEI